MTSQHDAIGIKTMGHEPMTTTLMVMHGRVHTQERLYPSGLAQLGWTAREAFVYISSRILFILSTRR